MNLSPPRLLTEEDNASAFDCGNPQLSNWLQSQAWKNQKHGDSRTYVSVDALSGQIVGFYSLSARSFARSAVKGRLARNAPNPIPVILLGQLAVSKGAQGERLGSSLFIDAVKRSQAAADLIGARAIVTEAIDSTAVKFYEHLGMTLLPESSNILYLLLK